MSELRYASLSIRTVDYQANDCLFELMCDAGDIYECNGITDLCNAETTDGVFEEVEEYCFQNGIAFDRKSEESIELSAQMRIFRPGNVPVDETVEIDITTGRPFISCEEILILLEDQSRTPANRIEMAIAAVQKRNFPCKQIAQYRSTLENEENDKIIKGEKK